MHSASKYLSGHSDTVAGVVAGSKALIARINDLTYPYLGAKLALRRVAAGPRDANAAVADAAPPYERPRRRPPPGRAPGRHGRPSSGPAAGPTTTGWSGLFSFEVAPSVDIPVLCDRLNLFRLGVSWGGHESLVFPAQVGLVQAGPANALVAFGVSPRLVRLHVGLEEPADLIADLESALTAAGG